ncbi:ArsR/SmtB family transcription factor [Haloplanus natans]|uniref:ArsR/SmtB family transcription factor n=1 Tax=Haloplanus natans TaxID=376171 RepID=UPI000677B4E9|nr:helix-turn-helix domain-containing protein [Haloplanus natans]
MSLLPSTDDVSAEQEGEIQVLGVTEDGTADVFDALASDTARLVLTAIYDEPAPPSALADRLDMSVQNVSYHLNNLEDAGIVQVADTRYSEKGKEMNVYAPADDPVVVFVGTETRKTGFIDLLKRLVGASALLLLGSVLLYIYQGFGLGAGGGSESTIRALLAVPGFEFLLGGLFILSLTVIWWRWNQ